MRVVRIFLSMPSDLATEAAQVADLVHDINETVQFLAPASEVRFELVQYATHAFPDVGAPQDVIDRQIPIDYDVYIGLMWKRAGTPTGDAPSGTVHEFNQALRHREEHGWPLIMFFFCDEKLDFPQTEEDVEQLRHVLAFRKRLASIGLTVTYAEHETFRDVLRPRLLRGLADVLATLPGAVRSVGTGEPTVSAAAAQQVRVLAAQYDEIRRTMRSGVTRTRRMTGVFNAMVELASAVQPLLGELQASGAAGERLAAIAVLHAFPRLDQLAWLADRLDNPDREAPFVGYQAAVALGQAARSLPAEAQPQVGEAIEAALVLAEKLPSDPDRIRALQFAREESRRRERAGA